MGVKANYTSKVWLIYLVTLADLVFNGIADHSLVPASGKVLPTIWVGVQFFIQLLNLTFFTMLLFDTYLFQVGLVGVLVQEFRGLLVGLGAYAVVYASYAAVKLSLLHDQHKTEDDMWSMPLFQAFSILQKLCALGYYVLVLYYSAKLGEPQWYQRHHWVARYSGIAPQAGAAGADVKR